MFVVIPSFNDGSFAYWSAVGLGRSGPDVVSNLAAGWDIKSVTLLLTFGITGFAALRSKWALLATPTLGWRFVGDNVAYLGTGWHYSLVLMPVVFIAVLDAVPRLQASPRQWLAAYAGHLPATCAGVALALCLTFPIHSLMQTDIWRPNPRTGAADTAMALIPPGTSVETDRGLIAHLVTDHTVYWFNSIGGTTPDYVLVDTRTGFDIANAATYAATQHPDAHWLQIFARDGYLVAQRQTR